MKEYKVGEEFEFNGVRLRCEISIGFCIGCYGFENGGIERCNAKMGFCESMRTDCNAVIFVEVQDV